jgi:Protein of unknown function (DUF2442)
MSILVSAENKKVKNVTFTDDSLSVALVDGRIITVPIVWYPRLLQATHGQRSNWQISGGGFGIHWPEIDEDLSVEGILLGKPSCGVSIKTET